LKEQKMAEITTDANQKVSVANTEKQLTEQQLNLTSKELERTVTTLQEVEELTREQKMEIELNQAKINEQNALLETERLKRRYLFIGLMVLSLFVLVLSFMIHKINRANKKIEQQRQSLEKQNKEISSSINYAQTIQKAMSPSTAAFEKYFDPFIMYRPKDIVSGDFYWISTPEDNKTQRILFAVVDCTGHGVPGAFMSRIGNRLLNEIVNEKNIGSPAEILYTLNHMIRDALRQEETDNNDGMDMAICALEKKTDKKYLLTFSGAKRPLYVIRNAENKLVDLRGDRKSIGGYSLNNRDTTFTNHEIEVEKGDIIYMMSDGITDQNNPDRKKFGRIQLEEAFVDCAKLSSTAQHKIIEERLVAFMDNEEQRDDITLIGLKII
jgi:serine phosphatase RsbU (regulator of sigma subunit)